MVAASVSSRIRPGKPVKRRRGRPVGLWVMLGVVAALVVLFAWQLVSPMLRAQIAVREPVSISRVSLESDPAGSRVDMVIVDRVGQDTTANADIAVKVREPDGAVWQATRTVTAAD